MFARRLCVSGEGGEDMCGDGVLVFELCCLMFLCCLCIIFIVCDVVFVVTRMSSS